MLDVLHHQHEEGGSGHSGTVFCDPCWNLDRANEISARVMIKILSMPRANKDQSVVNINLYLQLSTVKINRLCANTGYHTTSCGV